MADRESLVSKSDIAELKHDIELMVRVMTIRTALMWGAGVAILAALKVFWK